MSSEHWTHPNTGHVHDPHIGQVAILNQVFSSFFVRSFLLDCWGGQPPFFTSGPKSKFDNLCEPKYSSPPLKRLWGPRLLWSAFRLQIIVVWLQCGSEYRLFEYRKHFNTAIIWIPQTFEYQTFWSSDFKWFGFQIVSLWDMSYVLDRPFKCRTST